MPRKMLEGALRRAKSFVLCLSCTCTMNDYVSDTFLLVNSAVSGKHVLCKITAKRANKHTAKNFVGFRIHSHPASTALFYVLRTFVPRNILVPRASVRFPFKKTNSKKFPLGISVWEERVPFVTSSIRGSRERTGRLNDRERY